MSQQWNADMMHDALRADLLAALLAETPADVAEQRAAIDEHGATFLEMQDANAGLMTEQALLDALARLAAGPGLQLGEGTRYVGSFRAHGLLVPVWDAPLECEPEQLEEPAAALRSRLDEELASDRPLTIDERRARSGLLSRQLTLN